MIEITSMGDIDRFYRKTCKENNIRRINRDDYRRIVSGFTIFMMDKVFEGYEVALSGGDSMGTISIAGKKLEPRVDEEGNVKGLPIAWGQTFRYWEANPEAKEKRQAIYATNEHSDGIKYNLAWNKSNIQASNKVFYKLCFARGNRRRVWAEVMAGKEYVVYHNKKKKKDLEFKNIQPKA